MNEFKLYGASDDLIEIRGKIKKEWNRYNAGKRYIVFSDGTLLSIEYDGEWKINEHHAAESTTVTVYAAGSEEAEEISGRDYSDAALISTFGDIEYIALAEEVKKAR